MWGDKDSKSAKNKTDWRRGERICCKGETLQSRWCQHAKISLTGRMSAFSKSCWRGGGTLPCLVLSSSEVIYLQHFLYSQTFKIIKYALYSTALQIDVLGFTGRCLGIKTPPHTLSKSKATYLFNKKSSAKCNTVIWYQKVQRGGSRPNIALIKQH